MNTVTPVKRAASFGDRMKNLLRPSYHKQSNVDDHPPAPLEYRIRVRSDPKLVRVMDEPVTAPARLETVTGTPTDETTRDNPSLCPTDEGQEPVIAAGVLDVSYTSDAVSLLRPLRPVAVIPVNDSPRKGRPQAQEDTGSAGTDSTSSTSEPREGDSPTVGSGSDYDRIDDHDHQ